MARLSSSAPTEFTARSSKESLGSLQTAGAHVLGIVMNKIDRREAGSYSYESGFSRFVSLGHQERSAPTVRDEAAGLRNQQIDWERPAVRRERVGTRAG